MIAPLLGPIHRPRCSTTRAIGAAGTRRPTSPHGPGSCRPDAYGGYNDLYREGRGPGPVLEAGCFAHARRKFSKLADVVSSARNKSHGQRSSMIYPIALEAVQRLTALFDIERGINGKSPAERVAVHQELSGPLMADLHAWFTEQLAMLSCGHDLTKACFYMFKRWDEFTRSLDDGHMLRDNQDENRATI